MSSRIPVMHSEGFSWKQSHNISKYFSAFLQVLKLRCFTWFLTKTKSSHVIGENMVQDWMILLNLFLAASLISQKLMVVSLLKLSAMMLYD